MNNSVLFSDAPCPGAQEATTATGREGKGRQIVSHGSLTEEEKSPSVIRQDTWRHGWTGGREDETGRLDPVHWANRDWDSGR